MQRAHLIQLLEATLAAAAPAYALQVARRYLADWPGDLAVQMLQARALAAARETDAAQTALEAVVAADPENSAAQRLLAQWLPASEAQTLAYACAHIGDGLGAPAGVTLPAWAASLRTAALAEKTGDCEAALHESRAGLALTTTPLPALVHLCALWHAGRLELALPLAEGLAARWPRVVAFKLCLAEGLFATQQHGRAIQLLHDAAAQDVAGEVAARHWGEAHAYQALWQAELTADLPGPLPAELIHYLGLNRLPGRVAPRAEAHSHPPAPSEAIAEIQATLDALASQLQPREKASSPGAPGREVFLLLSSRTRLGTLYGVEGFTQVDAAIHALAQAQTLMRPLVVYVDDAATLQPFGLAPVNALSAWDIKLLIGQLHEKLRASGEPLGALLIVGGADIIPFHHLPNPTEDPDADIPSDNPYATADENYFVPEWAVGRMPTGVGDDPSPLVRALKKAASAHTQHRKTAKTQRSWLADLVRQLMAVLFRRRRERAPMAAFGYSANVWKDASAVVYDAIGNRAEMLTSPPVDVSRLPAEGLAPARLSYFNLHGIEDGPEWYGQRAPSDPPTLAEYPVALRPSDVVNSGRAPVVVFSEACYGANILRKTVHEALCLRFLDSGTRALVGSTKIAYGSVAEPLIAADLLGRCFWQNINAGLLAGEALRLAKLQMAQEMHNRQGFLDGEDQKTLISFVLYGDPLALALPPLPSAAKEAKRRALRFTTLGFRPTAAQTAPLEAGAITPERVAHIKAVAARYLPGMSDAEVLAGQRRLAPAAPGNAKRAAAAATVFTLSKTIQVRSHKHPHFARITFDDAGQVIKVAVSR